jgi:hypothetical protein
MTATPTTSSRSCRSSTAVSRKAAHCASRRAVELTGAPHTSAVPPVVVRNDEWTWGDIFNRLYKDRTFDNIVISPGPGSPACPADIGGSSVLPCFAKPGFVHSLFRINYLVHAFLSGVCLRILLECGDIPILGVCLGHQVIFKSTFLFHCHPWITKKFAWITWL